MAKRKDSLPWAQANLARDKVYTLQDWWTTYLRILEADERTQDKRRALLEGSWENLPDGSKLP